MLWRIPVAAVLSAVLMMLWGFLFWAQSGIPEKYAGQANDEAAVLATLSEQLPSEGSYFMPNPYGNDTPEKHTQFKELHEAGPLVQVFYHPGGAPLDDTNMYLQGLGHYFVTALLAAILVGYTARKRTLIGRFFVALLLVIFALCWILPGNVIWFYHPRDFALMILGYNFVGGLLMSLVVALLVKRKVVDD